jgi:hypothetical protein
VLDGDGGLPSLLQDADTGLALQVDVGVPDLYVQNVERWSETAKTERDETTPTQA